MLGSPISKKIYKMKHFDLEQALAGAVTRIDSCGREILRIDKEGMVYMGQRVKDAGEAYEAWMKTMKLLRDMAEEK